MKAEADCDLLVLGGREPVASHRPADDSCPDRMEDPGIRAPTRSIGTWELPYSGSRPNSSVSRVESAAVAYDTDVADRIRARIGPRPGLTEREMFGGIAFMINGNMAVGVSGEELMVRVGKEAHEQAVARPGTRTFDMGARPMKGWISVTEDGYDSEEAFEYWVDQGVAYAESLPAK